jgi:aryl-alcohol dehydrogenase-like predicted oxidoreductase
MLIKKRSNVKKKLTLQQISAVIPGIRNIEQAQENAAVSELEPLSQDLLLRLRRHVWFRTF